MRSSSKQDRLKALQQDMRGCRLCLDHGHDITPGAIFSGETGARVMLIGQAPGVTEVEAKRPFNAGSGTRLFEWLGQAGLDEADFRGRQYMTAVTKCFPGKASDGGGDRVPTREEQSLCRPYLDAELELVDPKLILPVGRLAINLFYPARQPLTAIIGTETRHGDRWVIPLPHPSGASRWHQIDANRARIRQAIELIELRRSELGL
jgi:uracil-DNA glycosylase family 4